MKHYLPFLALLLLCLGCAPPKKSNQKGQSNSSLQHKNKEIATQQIAPGTCLISLKACKVISKNDQTHLIGKVEKIHGYGAGFTETFSINQEVSFPLPSEFKSKINTKKSVVCVLNQVMKMNNQSSVEISEIKL